MKALDWPPQNPKNVIIRMPNWIGDLVMATPVLTDLRNYWKGASLTALCQSNVAPVIENDPHIDEIISFHKPSGWIHRFHHIDLIERLRMGNFDLGILLTNSFSSAWWFWRGKVQNRVGFAGNLRNSILNKAIPFPKDYKQHHLVWTYKKLIESLGVPLSDTGPCLYPTEPERLTAQNFLKNFMTPDSILVGVNPGAAYGSAKCWPSDRFKEVTRELLKNPKIIVLYFGDQAGEPLVREICSHFTERVINLAGKTSLRELMPLIECCRVFLSNDSGPMHIADALGVPLVALFGSTSDTRTGPYNKGKVIRKNVECSPCYKRVCPIDFRCMKRIGVQEVYDALMKQGNITE